MEEEYINGRMEGIMTENTNKIGNLDLEYFIGQMVDNIRDIGKKVNSMVKEL